MINHAIFTPGNSAKLFWLVSTIYLVLIVAILGTSFVARHEKLIAHRDGISKLRSHGTGLALEAPIFTSCPFEYQVVTGDTLYSIAETNHISLEELLEANPWLLDEGDSISIVLVIPCPHSQ